MGEAFRFVDLGPQDPFQAFGRMPVLGTNVHEGKGPIMTTSVWGATHLNVGWFDDVDATLDLERCHELGVQVIRRPVYGGGTAFYEAGSAVMWSWLLPKDAHPDLDAELARFQPVVTEALRRLGLEGVVFEGSSDLRFNGRKLGALTGQDVVLCNSVGGFINNRPPDLDTYLRVVRIPDDKFKDKAVKDMREYVVTAEEIRGKPLPYEEFRDASWLPPKLPASSCTTSPSPKTRTAGCRRSPGRSRGTSPCAASRLTAFGPRLPPGARSASATRRGASCAGPALPWTAAERSWRR